MAHLPFNSASGEQLIKLARFVNAAGDQHGVAVAIHQARLGVHVEQDVGDDLFQPRLAGQHPLHGAPLLLELGLGQVVQSLGLGVEPIVDLLLRGDGLVDVPRLVAQIQHHALAHRLVELVGVDVAAEHLDAFLLVRLEQRRAGEADEQRIGQQRLHGLVQFARLGAVALIDEHMNVALGLEVRRQLLDGLDERLGALVALRFAITLTPEFVHQRAYQGLLGAVQLVDQIRAAGGAVDGLIDALEHLFDLFVQFGAVGDDQHPRALAVLAYPFGQPDHDQRLAAALGVPDDAALAAADEILRGLDAKILALAA